MTSTDTKTRRIRKPSKKAQAAKQRYAENENYREAQKVRQRKHYRKNLRGEFELVSPLRSLTYFREQAELMEVWYKGGKMTAPCFSKTKAAELLQISPQSFWRQIRDGDDATIPPPVLVTINGGREQPVYHLEEMHQMLTIIGEHKRQYAYLRKDHTHTVEKLATTFAKIRKKLEGQLEWPESPDAPTRRKKPRKAPRRLK